MARLIVAVLGLVLFVSSSVSARDLQLQLTYDTYAAGIRVLQTHADFGLGPETYHLTLSHHTTGLVSLFDQGRQSDTVHGEWRGDQAMPVEFSANGARHGRESRSLIDYDQGVPIVKELQPPQAAVREPVPLELQAHTIDTLSALAQLVRGIEQDRGCDAEAHIYDGRRALDILARTAGPDRLDPTGRSSFSGPSLRCNLEIRELAGFLLGEDDPEHRQPRQGSIWFAPLLPDAPPLPVRIAFPTQWFGMATTYLTGVTARPE